MTEEKCTRRHSTSSILTKLATAGSKSPDSQAMWLWDKKTKLWLPKLSSNVTVGQDVRAKRQNSSLTPKTASQETLLWEGRAIERKEEKGVNFLFKSWLTGKNYGTHRADFKNRDTKVPFWLNKAIVIKKGLCHCSKQRPKELTPGKEASLPVWLGSSPTLPESLLVTGWRGGSTRAPCCAGTRRLHLRLVRSSLAIAPSLHLHRHDCTPAPLPSHLHLHPCLQSAPQPVICTLSLLFKTTLTPQPAWLHTCTPSHLLHLPCTPSLQFAHQRHNLWFAHYLNCSNQALHWHDCTIVLSPVLPVIRTSAHSSLKL